jgi:hypothetical protein
MLGVLVVGCLFLLDLSGIWHSNWLHYFACVPTNIRSIVPYFSSNHTAYVKIISSEQFWWLFRFRYFNSSGYFGFNSLDSDNYGTTQISANRTPVQIDDNWYRSQISFCSIATQNLWFTPMSTTQIGARSKNRTPVQIDDSHHKSEISFWSIAS